MRNITKHFPGVLALADVSLQIRPGESHALCGENGAGKSTLMNILGGVITDYEGQIVLRDLPVRFNGPRDAEAAGVSIIHQELNLIDELSVAANIFLGREIRTGLGLLDDAAMERASAALLDELECHIPPGRRVGELRMGDQQFVEIAKALSLENEILIMDEPTSALTPAEADLLFRVIQRLRRRGVTILYISHKIDEIFRLCDRISILRDGALVATLDRDKTNPREVTRLMVGREIHATDFDPDRQMGEIVLGVENLSLPAPEHVRGWRLKDISFALRRGEILGISGLMGAGRTELLECLFGCATEEPSGRIFLNGSQVRFHHPVDAIKAGVALVTEDRKRLGIFSQMSVGQNITISALARMARMGFVRRNLEADFAAESVRLLTIKLSSLEDPVTSLSGGNQQKTILARWLLNQPKILLLDDPTRGIDVGAKAELYRLMQQFCRNGLAIILTSSELPELLKVCDRIVVLCEGRLTGEFRRDDATEEKIMEATTMTGRTA
jgi:ABC-type sugar transport system ATPase subunit